MLWLVLVVGIAGFITLELQLVALTAKVKRLEKERDAWKLAAHWKHESLALSDLYVPSS